MQLRHICFTIFFLLQGILMSATIDSVTVNDHEVPLIYERGDALPIISMQVVFKGAGSLNDDNLPGLARLSSMMLNEGTWGLGPNKFADLLESRAIDLKISHGRETFVINLDSLKIEFDEGIKLLIKLLEDPNLSEDTLAKVKTKQLGALKRKENDFDYIASRTLYKNIFKGTPIEYASSGDEESINKITLNDLLKILCDIYDVKFNANYEDARKGDIKKSYATIDKAKANLNWNPAVDLKEGLSRLCSTLS